MESANLRHQRQLPDQLVGSPPALVAPSCYGFGTNPNHAWSTSSTNTSTFSSIGNSIASNSRNSNVTTTRQIKSSHDNHNNILVSSDNVPQLINTSNMVNDLGFPWTNYNAAGAGSFTDSTSTSPTQSAYDMHLAKIKEEFSESFPKFTEMLSSGTNLSNNININDDYGHFFVKNERSSTTPTTENLLVKALSSSSSSQVNGNQILDNSEFDSNINGSGTSFGGLFAMGCRGQFSQIYPSINISNLSQSSSSTISASSGLGINCINSHPLNDNNLGVFRESHSNNFCGLLDQMHQPHRLSCGHGKGMPSFNSEIAEAKRPGSLMEPKMTQSAPNKKSRLESRSSCPPFKVRKEKLGDRIAALQQLVSPFGKTDTASVLMEAIGYIKFLQDQVETLSVPYMKSSRNKPSTKPMQRGLKEDESEEPKRDLRSRGLCLVPLSCMSYVTGDGGGGSIWPQPSFGGRT